MPKHPEVTVQLSGQDGNAFIMAGRTRTALKRAGVPDEDQAAFLEEALSGDYDHVVQTIMAWVTVE